MTRALLRPALKALRWIGAVMVGEGRALTVWAQRQIDHLDARP